VNSLLTKPGARIMISPMKTSIAPKVVALSVLLAALVVSNVNAAFDAFLKIDGIDGEATATGHEDQIEILSFSWGVSNPSALAQHGGSGSGGPVLLPVTMAKRIDKATPKLMRAAVAGEVFKNAAAKRVPRPISKQISGF
jgi:hypothetical protein